MSKRKGGSYIGGSSVIRDPAWPGKLAARIRKTRKHQERVKRDQQRLADEWAAYEARPQSELLTPDRVRQSKPKQPG
jgi:hypothetical protein